MEKLANLGLSNAGPEEPPALARMKALRQQLSSMHAPKKKESRPWVRAQPATDGEESSNEEESSDEELETRHARAKPRWKCPECTQRNPLHVLRCKECGFWKCRYCGQHNNSRRPECRGCHRSPDGSKAKKGSKATTRRKRNPPPNRWGGFLPPPPPPQRLAWSATTRRSAPHEEQHTSTPRRSISRHRGVERNAECRLQRAASAPPQLHVKCPWIPPGTASHTESHHVMYTQVQLVL